MTTLDKPSQIGGLRITRKAGERIVVNNGEIIIEVTQIKGQRVKLSFLAHKDVSIKRGEVVEAMGPSHQEPHQSR